MFRLLSIALLIGLLFEASSVSAELKPESPAFSPTNGFRGEFVKSKEVDALLVTRRLKSGGPAYFLIQGIFKYQSSGWRNFEYLADYDGNQFPIDVFRRNVSNCGRWSGCFHIESFEVRLTAEQMIGMLIEGQLIVKAYARSGHEVLIIFPKAHVTEIIEGSLRLCSEC